MKLTEIPTDKVFGVFLLKKIEFTGLAFKNLKMDYLVVSRGYTHVTLCGSMQHGCTFFEFLNEKCLCNH